MGQAHAKATGDELDLIHTLRGEGYSVSEIAYMVDRTKSFVQEIFSTRVTRYSYPHERKPLRRCPGCGGMVYMPCCVCSPDSPMFQGVKR